MIAVLVKKKFSQSSLSNSTIGFICSRSSSRSSNS